MRRSMQIFLSLVATLSIYSCSSNLETQCVGNACTEQELNKPLREISDVESQSTKYTDEFSHIEVTRGDYAHIDPEHLVPQDALERAIGFYDQNFDKIKNKRWLAVADLGQHSSKKRLYLVDMVTGKVLKYHVAHGTGSDPDDDGYATKFSNINNSKMSSLGFYFTAETYIGNNGYSLRIDGLQSSNSLARERNVVIHPAKYVSESEEKADVSWGCPAMDPSYSRDFIDKVKGGSLYFIYHAEMS